MAYKDGTWGKKAQERSKKRREYFKQYRKKKSQNKPAFKPKGCVKRNARQKVRDHLLAGKIIKPKKCSSCRKQKRLEAHHEDYSKPLEIDWLCKACHVEADKNLKLINS